MQGVVAQLVVRSTGPRDRRVASWRLTVLQDTYRFNPGRQEICPDMAEKLLTGM